MQQLALELAPPPVPTLEGFFPGRNATAVAALREALAGGERAVYLWGEPGSGKTHLMRAAVSEAETLGRSALYIGAPHAGLSPTPVEDLNKGARPPSPKSDFPIYDVIAVDDVERLDIVAQLALFDAFNAARTANGCLIFAGVPPAAELPLREDLRTRLGSGVSLRLVALDDEEKAAALACHAAQRGLVLGPDIVAYVLTHCRRDMGTQVGVLDALDRYSLEQKRPVTLPLVRQALKQLAI